MAGPFSKWLRPDEPKGRPAPFTYPGHYVAKLQGLTALACGLAVVGLVFGGTGFWWGLRKDTAPPEVLAVLIDRAGEVVKASYVSESEEASQDVVNLMLRNIVWNLRTQTPDKRIQGQIYEDCEPFFRGVAGTKIKAFLKSVDYYKKRIEDGRRRLVEGPIYARRRPGDRDFYIATWTEAGYDRAGREEPGSRRELQMEFQVSHVETADMKTRKENPYGVVIDDFGWNVPG